MDLKSVSLFVLLISFGVSQSQEVFEISNHFGIIQSPGFPNSYGPNQNVTWVIETLPGYVIEIDITDFYLEVSYEEDVGKCPYDYVTISDGDEEEKFCGNRENYPAFAPTHKPYVSDTNKVTVNFVTDYSNEEEGLFGFRLYYSKVDADECAQINEGIYYGEDVNWDEALYCNHHCVNFPGSYECLCKPGYTLHEDKHTCKIDCETQILTEMSGVVTSNNYPNKYSKFSDCKTVIQAPANHSIEYTCDDSNFHIENHYEETDCPYDRLTITYNGISNFFCGEAPPHAGVTEQTGAEVVEFHFTSDRSLEYNGFNCTYNIIENS